MASSDKNSTREEFDKIKTQYSDFKKKKKVPVELSVIFSSLIMLMELLLVIFLEKKTKKDSKNSSKPSSQTEKDESALDQPGSKGKGKAENDALAENTRVEESVTILCVYDCEACGRDLEDVPNAGYERRTRVDIVFEKTLEHVDAETKQCPDCNAVAKATFPSDMPGPIQYGRGIKAYIITLLVCQMVAMKRVQGLIKTMIGRVISEATMLKFILRLYHALEGWETTSIEQLLKTSAMHVDETSLRVDKKNHWIHTYSSGEITLKCLDRKRGREAIETINIIPRYSGNIIHDCLKAYFSYDNCGHGLCGSHLLRELTFVIDSNDYRWARDMKKLLKDSCNKVSKSKRKRLSKPAYKKLQRRYRTIMTLGKKEMPPIPPKPKGKRGVVAKSDAHNLWERLDKHETAVLLFAKDPHVAFTNNRAERDLRMAKVKQKVSGCFRTELYAKAYCRISSYLQTMANQGYNPLIAIQIALAGKIEGIGGE